MSTAAALRDQARQFLGWWGSELKALLPEAILAARKPRPHSDIHVAADGITIERIAAGVCERFHESRTIEQLDEEGWGELAQVVAGTRTRLVLGVPDVYIATLSLPAAARGRLRAAVSFQLPQISPLEPTLLLWTAVPGAPADGRIPVIVPMARTERVEALQAMFAGRGLPVPAIAAQGADSRVELSRGGAGGDDAGRRATRRAVAAGILLLLSIPLTTIAGAWLLAGMADDRAASLSRQIAPRLVAERKAEREAELRRALAVVHRHPSATATIEALALGTPDTDHLTAAARAPDGSWRASVDSADPDALQSGLANAPLAPQAQAGETVPMEGKPGRTRIEIGGRVQ